MEERGVCAWLGAGKCRARLSGARAVVAVALVLAAACAQAQQPQYALILESLQEDGDLVPAPPDAAYAAALFNREAIVPPQCYTRTEGRHNPCYVCHQDPRPDRENQMADADLQVAYSFSEVGLKNHWLNLFEDRSQRVAAIGDDEILAWIDDDNYSELAGRLHAARFSGWIPDLEGLAEGGAAFDRHGFALDDSGWVAFNYKPFPSTFWPTNGSTDDVMIRLPRAFRSTADGRPSTDVYRANLAIVEATVKGLPAIGSLPVDETALGIDLDGDGQLSKRVQRITNVRLYVGAASQEFRDTWLYPEGTEFLHTVRYLGFAPGGEIVPSRRMKEVRYMKKWVAYRKSVYARQYQLEAYDKELGNLPRYPRLGHNGLDNKSGWSVQGFIEDRAGRLRFTTYEENLFCMGCHASVGATIDKTFSLPRKIDGARGWGYIDLHAMRDVPNRGESAGEIETYFERVGGGDEFRSNDEMMRRWFDAGGVVDHERVRGAADVYELIVPSRERALVLNKAYRVLVADQDFLFGRDATVTPPANVYDRVDNARSPTLPPEREFVWDIRLDW